MIRRAWRWSRSEDWRTESSDEPHQRCIEWKVGPQFLSTFDIYTERIGLLPENKNDFGVNTAE